MQRAADRTVQHLGLAWPVFVVFLAQRLTTVAFLATEPDGLWGLSRRWDAGWYLRLADSGYVYPNIPADGRVDNSNLAYFPLFPWLVRQVSDTGALSSSTSLLVLSWVGGLLAVWGIFAVGNALYGRWTGVALAALWGMAPASLALTMGYPEGWFTAAAAGTLFCLIRRHPLLAGCCAAVAGLLRPSAVAVIAMVVAYCLLELVRWRVRRRRQQESAWSGEWQRAAGVGERAAGLAHHQFPARACVAAVVSTLGLGAFMIYVALRTGSPLGYFTVQAQWGQQSAGLTEYWAAVQHGLLDPGQIALVAANLVICLGYVLLFCLIVFDRSLVWASVYAAGMLLVSLTHVTFQHVYARQLLPAFVLLIPLVRLRVPRLGAIAALTVGSLVMSWGSAAFLLAPHAAM